MADLAGRAARPPVDLAVDDEPGAHSPGHLDVRQVAHAAPASPDQLAEGAEVGVVVHGDGHAEPFAEGVGGLGAGPAGQYRGGAEHSGGDVDGPRHTEAHPGDLGAVHSGGVEEAADQQFGAVETLLGGGVHVERLGLLGEDLVGEVADGDAQVGVAEVDADDDAGVPAQRDAAGAPAAGRGGGHLDGAALLQLPDDVGDGGRGEAGGPGDLRLGQRPGEPHGPHHPLQIGPVQRRLRPRCLHRPIHSCPLPGGPAAARRATSPGGAVRTVYKF